MQIKTTFIKRKPQQSSKILLKTTLVSQSGHLLNLCLSYGVGWLGYINSILEMIGLWFIVKKRYQVIVQI